MRAVAITTSDNPFNPILDFDNWYHYDEIKGYHSSEYLARIANLSDGLSDSLNQKFLEDAIDEIVKFNLLGNYEKVVVELPDS